MGAIDHAPCLIVRHDGLAIHLSSNRGLDLFGGLLSDQATVVGVQIRVERHAVIVFLHLVPLLHDDLVLDSPLDRGCRRARVALLGRVLLAEESLHDLHELALFTGWSVALYSSIDGGPVRLRRPALFFIFCAPVSYTHLTLPTKRIV